MHGFYCRSQGTLSVHYGVLLSLQEKGKWTLDIEPFRAATNGFNVLKKVSSAEAQIVDYLKLAEGMIEAPKRSVMR